MQLQSILLFFLSSGSIEKTSCRSPIMAQPNDMQFLSELCSDPSKKIFICNYTLNFQ